MATKSFLKTISLQSKKQAQAFICAAEKSFTSTREPKDMLQHEPVRELTKEQIRKIFCEGQNTEETT